ncbi:carbohydrate esterase family 9 protein [Coniophora puteana RWD-64-598 SS2]|uniref:Carbohydrate esterase family 9 protein n=1 Tax=Coniophora puteana (strain RWD-64-598) TaxID=741705 RepID=A0A5M3MUZ7_CONPW|nr:carbohydrate esterase family 9 protein [Coniophora puteana RWD-64-598 SS2]EIW82936.1 carbohydrate esterase family 9 protein [Coniophora puteana RWD-64-598 SS2]
MFEKDDAGHLQPRRRSSVFRLGFLAAAVLTFVTLYQIETYKEEVASPRLLKDIARCHYLARPAGPEHDFYSRSHSDRFVPGTRPTLVLNATIWTGQHNGTQVINGGELLLDRGLILAMGKVDRELIRSYKQLHVIDADGAWVTPGIIDMHTHLGDAASPALDGAQDDNSIKGPIVSWLRSLDGLNTHDDSYRTTIAGGVTTSLVLPGSANVIGGQAFAIKLRTTKERSPTSMLLEPPFNINTSFPDTGARPRWRHLKQACGENPSGVYSNTRMDNVWAFRQAYNEARKVKESQDAFCSKLLQGERNIGDFPESLQWESLVDVLRGKVKVHTHCYEPVDLDDLMRLSNEFEFPIAAVHHASEAYLVPDLLKTGYGHPPAVALFATDARYKREAYRSSEFAPRVLAQHGIQVAMKSDHPVQNSRFLLYEAQQAYYYGMPYNLAMASVMSTPAQVLGLDHRVGFIQEGYDADIVMWDSHPLALGATPTHVFIDGISQLKDAHVQEKPAVFQELPKVPDFDADAQAAVEYEGLPPLEPKKRTSGFVLFRNVKSLYVHEEDGSVAREVSLMRDDGTLGVVLVHEGKVCYKPESTCAEFVSGVDAADTIDLEGGALAPGLVSFGAPLGLAEIDSEPSTKDGVVTDPLTASVPRIAGGDDALVHASDGLQFGGRDALLAYRAGVTSAITAPIHRGFWGGLSAHFSLGAAHRLQDGAVIRPQAGVHMSISHFGTPSISTQIGTLRRLLLSSKAGEAGFWFEEVRKGRVPLVVEAHSADIIATLIELKREVEQKLGTTIKLTVTGASEAHLLAPELSANGVGVIMNPARAFPYAWEDRRILPGPPLTERSAISTLIEHNVTVGVGVLEAWDARNARFDLAWAWYEAAGSMSRQEAMALASTNVEELLTGSVASAQRDLVATRGGDMFDMSSRVVAVVSARQGAVDLL